MNIIDTLHTIQCAFPSNKLTKLTELLVFVCAYVLLTDFVSCNILFWSLFVTIWYRVTQRMLCCVKL